MIIMWYDGTLRKCDSIEFSTDGKNIIIDGTSVRPLVEVLRVITE